VSPRTHRRGIRSSSATDAYAGLIPGWECSLTKDTDFVERALRHAATFRARQGHPVDDAIHHSDAGSQGSTPQYITARR
jgi:putative transposase